MDSPQFKNSETALRSIAMFLEALPATDTVSVNPESLQYNGPGHVGPIRPSPCLNPPFTLSFSVRPIFKTTLLTAFVPHSAQSDPRCKRYLREDPE